MKKKAGVVLIIAVLGIGVFVAATYGVIYRGVAEECKEARAEFGGDCREALEKLIDSGQYGAREKNRAVWALGQLADKRSINFLERKRGDKQINEYELNKALRWCNSGNWTSWMYNRL